MGILNVTPDSFSDGGLFVDPDAAIAHAMEMVEAGAKIIDVGGESTRPGAEPVSAASEIDRVLPIIEAVRSVSDVAISVDTSKPEVMRAAAAADVDLINDIYALRAEDALEAAAGTGLPVCLMHMQGEPRTMQKNPHYEDLVSEIREFFRGRIAACHEAGITSEKLVLDVGFGFGKTPVHNLALINRLEEFTDFGLPILVGLSRKSTIGLIDEDRISGSIGGALAALQRGARILRVHDVRQTVSAVKVWQSINEEQVLDSL
jgi:dihydropteroate synthase